MKGSMSRLGTLSKTKQWVIFIVLAFISGWLLGKAEVPAGLLLGSMVCAIVMGIQGANIRMPQIGFKTSQGVVGCLIAHSVTLPVLLSILKLWPMMLVATFVTLVLSVLVGVLSVRFGKLPGSTAAWGISPGGASVMMVMAEEYGADVRVVATMQYIRVICVVLMAALICHVLGAPTASTAKVQAAVVWDLADITNFAITLLIIGTGVLFGRFLPAGALLVPMILGAILQVFGVVDILIPRWLLVIVYGAIGAYVGLRFDRDTLRYVMYAMPVMLASSLSLIILCGVSALGISYYLDSDYLSAYLATSPGGLDSLSVIAIDVKADVGLVVAMQTLRLFAVVLTGPMLAKYTARFAANEVKGKQ